MICEYYKMTIFLESGKKYIFDELKFNESYNFEEEYLNLNIDCKKSIEVKIKLTDTDDKIQKVMYTLILQMRNYSKVIIPDSGRWFLKNTSLIDFWKNCKRFTSNISDIKIPLFMFLKNDYYVGSAIGVVGKNLETEFEVIEPESNRALNVHTGHIILSIMRGSDNYSLNKVSYDENLFYFNDRVNGNKPWLIVQREFSDLQRNKYNIIEQSSKKALEPMWCSWVDWDSKDINDKMLLSNIKSGVELGIKNFIIDDGWYGNGLDSDYSIDMDIGDWEPDLKKIKNMKSLVENIHEIGGRAIIWCAPHAVAEKSKSFKLNNKYLIADEEGKPIINEPQYYSYCFQCKESREIMANICVKLINKWGFDGAKYDLFNWVPNCKCKNPNHSHDVNSMIEGLEKTLKLINEKTRKIKPDYIVELKQNYGTLFNMQFGNLMRAGDSPFDIETNYQRTLHIQSYTPYALNDYQTFNEADSEEDVACYIIKMLSAGIPAYGVNFQKLDNGIKDVMRYYNNLYTENIDNFKEFRMPLNPNYTEMISKGSNKDYIFLLPNSNLIEINRESLIFNGTYYKSIVIKNNSKQFYNAVIKDCKGKIINNIVCKDKVEEIEVLVGGTILINYIS